MSESIGWVQDRIRDWFGQKWKRDEARRRMKLAMIEYETQQTELNKLAGIINDNVKDHGGAVILRIPANEVTIVASYSEKVFNHNEARFDLFAKDGSKL